MPSTLLFYLEAIDKESYEGTLFKACEAANLALMRSAGDNVMEYVIVGLVGMKNGELDAQLLFAEGLEPVIDEVPVFRDFTACVPVSYTHLLTEYNPLSFLNEDKIDKNPSVICQSFSLSLIHS